MLPRLHTIKTRKMFQEEPLFDCVFNRFRGIPGVDLLWVKEHIYKGPCIVDTCPTTRNLDEILDNARCDKLRKIKITDSKYNSIINI